MLSTCAFWGSGRLLDWMIVIPNARNGNYKLAKQEEPRDVKSVRRESMFLIMFGAKRVLFNCSRHVVLVSCSVEIQGVLPQCWSIEISRTTPPHNLLELFFCTLSLLCLWKSRRKEGDHFFPRCITSGPQHSLATTWQDLKAWSAYSWRKIRHDLGEWLSSCKLGDRIPGTKLHRTASCAPPFHFFHTDIMSQKKWLIPNTAAETADMPEVLQSKNN